LHGFRHSVSHGRRRRVLEDATRFVPTRPTRPNSIHDETFGFCISRRRWIPNVDPPPTHRPIFFVITYWFRRYATYSLVIIINAFAPAYRPGIALNRRRKKQIENFRFSTFALKNQRQILWKTTIFVYKTVGEFSKYVGRIV